MSVHPIPSVSVTYGDVEVTVAASEGQVSMQLVSGAAVLVRDARLGLTVDGLALGRQARIADAELTDGHEEYRARTGKAVGEHHVQYREARLTIEEVDGPTWGVVVRVSGGGAAFRYLLPSGDSVRLDAEETTIPIEPASRLWLLDYQPWYETPRFGAEVDELEPGDYGLPVLVRHSSGEWMLLAESAIDARFSGAHVTFSPGARPALAIRPAGPTRTPAGSATPWRTFAVGELADIVTSTLVDDLAPAADEALERAEWIRPGRAAWSWWSDFGSPASLSEQKRFAEYAARQGWEHILVDAGWSAEWLPELIAFASRRNVAVHVWSHWNRILGPHGMRQLALWKSWGVAGVKLDFMESESQERYLWYDAVIAETARLELMVNFHGSVIPRGWARTFPHVMSYEAIRGAEWYKLPGPNPTAAHNVIQAFTRNVIGSMDYTPVTFSAVGRETTDGHELALSVVFESGITHFADDVRQYASRPLADRFLRMLPPFWEETRLLAGTPDTEAVLARRAGDLWYVGCISTGPARRLVVDLTPLLTADDQIWLITDDADGGLREVLSGKAPGEESAEPLTVALQANGGFVAVIGSPGSQDARARPRELPSPRALEVSTSLHAVAGGVLEVVARGADTLRVPPGWAATRRGDETWQVVVPARPGEAPFHVLTAEARRSDGTAQFAHARVVVRSHA